MAAPGIIFPTIRDGLARRNLIFVFPSEITASFWRAETARRGPARAVRSDRFISWDTFKEQVLAEQADRVPVNRTTRTLFAATVVAENARAPFLARIIDPRYAAEADAFLADVEGMLPALAVLSAPQVYERLEPALRADVDAVGRRYRSFLDEQGLFEPAWEAQHFDPRGREYAVFYPRLITDFADFEAALAGHPAVRRVDVPHGAAADPGAGADRHAASPITGPVLREYETSRAEIRDLCAHLEALLEEGVPPDEIAVTVCGEDAFLTYLEDACRRRSIPASPRAGRPLTSYPAGRFFENLRALPQSGFSLRAMQALLLDRAVPWKEPGTLRRIVRFGIEGGCRRNYREGGRERDVWDAALGRAERRDERARYRTLRAQTRALAAAAGFEELRARLYELFGTFVETTAWEPGQLRVFQSCLDVLSDLIDTAGRTGLAPRRPFDLWLQAMRARVYVPREAGAGIALYPYRVAAGIEPRYHFIANASHARMRLLHAPYGFLRDDEKETLALADRDLSEDYAAAYAVSGTTVAASYARESFSGPQLPPSWFAERELVQRVRPGEAAADPFDTERGYFAGTAAAPRRVHDAQVAGLAHLVETGFRARRPDWSQEEIADTALLERLLAVRRNREGRLRLSPSEIRSYRHCPFGHFLGSLLRLDPEAYTIAARTALDTGNVYHRGFERLYARILEHTGVFEAAELDRYHGWVADAAAEATEAWAIGATSLSPAEVVALRMRLEESMHVLLDEDAARFDGWRIEVLERYEWVELDEGAVLGGFMDRRMLGPGGGNAAVIDYKKRGLPKDSAFRVDPAHPETLEELQLPLYAEILSRVDRTVAGLYLYSVEKARYRPVFAAGEKAVLDEQGLAAAREAARGQAAAMLEGVRRGDFRFPDPREGCEDCSFPGICRARFVTG
jgi:RecB family exonuclease